MRFLRVDVDFKLQTLMKILMVTTSSSANSSSKEKSGTNLGSDFFITRAELVELMKEHSHPQVECDAIEATYSPGSQFCASQLFALLGS